MVLLKKKGQLVRTFIYNKYVLDSHILLSAVQYIRQKLLIINSLLISISNFIVFVVLKALKYNIKSITCMRYLHTHTRRPIFRRPDIFTKGFDINSQNNERNGGVITPINVYGEFNAIVLNCYLKINNSCSMI